MRVCDHVVLPARIIVLCIMSCGSDPQYLDVVESNVVESRSRHRRSAGFNIRHQVLVETLGCALSLGVLRYSVPLTAMDPDGE